MTISVETFLTHDNIFSLQVLSRGFPVDLVATGVNRVVVTSALSQVDSVVYPVAFDYSTDGATGIIRFDFTDIPELVVGTHLCSITIFDAAHPNGQVWHDRFTLTVNPRVVRP